MKRRHFLQRTSAGFVATLGGPGVWSCAAREPTERSYDFRPYRPGQLAAEAMCITPDDGFYVHTYYDICPYSASGRYLAVTRLPYQRQKPRWGDLAEVCVIDLVMQTITTVYQTRAWSYQLGANLQWAGERDRYLWTNDLIDGLPVCVRIDLHTYQAHAFSGAKYDIAPSGKFCVSPNLLTMNTHQYGYAVPDPLRGTPGRFTKADMEHEGLWITDLVEDRVRLLAGFDQFARQMADPDFYRDGLFYCFHSKINRPSNRIMQVLRWQLDGKGRNPSLFTLTPGGDEIAQCLSRKAWMRADRLGQAGNHPNWHPDGEHIIMNCVPEGAGEDQLRFCAFRYDGSGFRVLSETHLGSGHPTVDPAWQFLLTDDYSEKSRQEHRGEIPIRLIGLSDDTETILCTVPNDVGGGGKTYLDADKKYGGSQHKLDAHPAWSRDYKQICFNGAPQGRRQVFVLTL